MWVRATAGLLLLVLGGCEGEGSLTVRLLQASFDRPLDGVERIELRVLDRELRQVASRSVAANGSGDLDLGRIASGQVRLQLLGLAGGQTVSSGQSRPLDLGPDSDLRELVPFATPRVAVAVPADRALSGALEVDGDLREWRASPSLVLDDTSRVAGEQATPSDLRAELHLAWSAGQLAFALEVADDCPALRVGQPAGSCGEATAAERIFIGLDGDDNGSDYGAGDLWIELTATGVTVQRGTATPEQLALVVAPRADLSGWVLEGAVQVEALGRQALGEGDRVGLDLVLVDADPGDSTPTALRWSGGEAAASQPTSPEEMGTVGFGQP